MSMSSGTLSTYLNFACGHAAMVSLPRIGGESVGQRKLRISAEKTAAEARPCDFCPPTDRAVVETTLANGHSPVATVEHSNGIAAVPATDHDVPDDAAAEPVQPAAARVEPARPRVRREIRAPR